MRVHLLVSLVLVSCAVLCLADEEVDPGLQDVVFEEAVESTIGIPTDKDTLEETSTTPRLEETSRKIFEEATTTEVEETTPEEEEEEFAIFQFFGRSEKGKDKEEEAVAEEGEATEPLAQGAPTEKAAAESGGGGEKLSAQMKAVLSNYKRYGSVTIPGNSLPDPMPLPSFKKSFAGTLMNFTQVTIHGLSGFEVDHINTDLDKMQVYIELKISRLLLLGNYSMRSFLGKGNGPFNVTLLSVVVSGSAQLEKDSKGLLRASETEMDMSFTDSVVDFKNTGMIGTILQGVAASAGPILFDAVKPAILSQVNEKFKSDVNGRLEKVGKGVGDEHPLDKAVKEGRKYVKEKGYDPYHLKDYVLRDGLFRLNVSELWVLGLSRFYRVGGVELSMDSGTIQAGLHLATGKLYGKCLWSLGFGNFERSGAANFTVNRLQVKASVNQSLDVSRHPVLDSIDIRLGKPTIMIERKDHVDKLLEYVINALPSFIRHIIVDTLEEPIAERVQSILDEIDVEDFVEKNIPALDQIEV